MVCDSPQSGASYRWLQQYKRLHAQHGPIDLIIEADGDESERVQAFAQAVTYFDSVLEDLVGELVFLRTPCSELSEHRFESTIAKRMHDSASQFGGVFVTPMAAVAGSVAEMTLAAMCAQRHLSRAFVNNGGDIAVHLQPGYQYNIGICDNPMTGNQSANTLINSASTIRGIASSGWHGRSHSLGIADAVTVLADSAAIADVAATLIANRVDLANNEKIKRTAARELSPESDLGEQAVTIDVAALSLSEKHQALSQGQRYAASLVSQGIIDSAYLSLQGEHALAGATQSIQWRHSA